MKEMIDGKEEEFEEELQHLLNHCYNRPPDEISSQLFYEFIEKWGPK